MEFAHIMIDGEFGEEIELTCTPQDQFRAYFSLPCGVWQHMA